MTENAAATGAVSIFPIKQATGAIFPDLYLRQTFLFFIEAGSKHVLNNQQEELIGEEGDDYDWPGRIQKNKQ